MYGIGDRVVYGAFGVMEIVDIVEQSFGDVTKQYYVMKEFSSPSNSLTYVPLDNAVLTEQMKPLLTKEEILDVIRTAKHSPLLDWIDDNRARSEYYKKLLAEHKLICEKLEKSGYPVNVASDFGDSWNWIDSPWPWEYEANV